MSGKISISSTSFLEPEKVSSDLKVKTSLIFNSQKSRKQQISKAQLKTHLITKFKKITKQKLAKQKKFTQVLKNSSQPISDEKNFTCPICLQVLISPVIFECGHFGCMKCIETVSVYQNKCFLCRKVFECFEHKPSYIISTIINKNVLRNIENPIQHYTRLADHLQWQKKKNLSIMDIQIGSLVDVKCGESGKWKNGVILSIKNPEIQKITLLIKYKFEGENMEELIDMNSSRLAKHGFYTEKRAILTQNDQFDAVEIDIPQISIEDFQNIPMDRNLFFNERKEENYFPGLLEAEEEFTAESKVLTPQSSIFGTGWDHYERDLQEFLNPQMDQSFLQPEFLEVYF